MRRETTCRTNRRSWLRNGRPFHAPLLLNDPTGKNTGMPILKSIPAFGATGITLFSTKIRRHHLLRTVRFGAQTVRSENRDG